MECWSIESNASCCFPSLHRSVSPFLGMGQKTNPIGLRLAVNKDWRSKWFAGKKEFGKLLGEDREIRKLLKKKLESASVPRILIERAANRCRITILTARPGVVIGRKGAEIDKLKEEMSRMTGKEVYVDIVEVKRRRSRRNWSRKTSRCSLNAACLSGAR